MSNSDTNWYALIDTGEGARLERFGDRVLIRPSKLSMWKRRSPAEWRSAHATFDHKAGWKFSGAKFSEWIVSTSHGKLELLLQDNGQVGLFPEHEGYLDDVERVVRDISTKRNSPARVLNLFAYTGMASIACARAGAEVVHVDLSKRILDWTGKNLTMNGLTSVRLIREDALAFLEREKRREKQYDIVIADPPSFSRISEKNSWTLDEVLSGLLESIVSVMAQESVLFCTSHHFESGGHVMANIISDVLEGRGATVETKELLLKEEHSPRMLPAGFLVRASTLKV